MKPIHYNEATFEAFEINDIPALFTNLRIKRNSIPKGYHAYDIRGDDTTDFATIETKVTVNHTGTIIIEKKLDLKEQDFFVIDDYNFTGEEACLESLSVPEPSFQEIIDNYTKRLEAYFLEIEESCRAKNSKNRPTVQASPSYLEEVIIPIYKLLAEHMRKKRKSIKIPSPLTYKPIKEYYRIKVGLTTVGGFSVPDGDDFSIYFTPLKSALPIGERVKMENTEQLSDLILAYLKKEIDV